MKARILELSYKHKLGHLSSNLTTAAILEEIFPMCGRDDSFILSNGHAGLALYCALEKFQGQDAEQLLSKHGSQPHLDPARGIHCSTGSLGQGLTVAVGYAMARPTRKVHCIISDGECAEGCVWESLAFIQSHHLDNCIVYVNMNGYSALSAVDIPYLETRLVAFLPRIHILRTNVIAYPFLQGINGHYHVMTDEEYKSTL